MPSRDTEVPWSRFFRHPQWLGFRHDGYPVVSLAQYLKIRQEDSPSDREEAAEVMRKMAASTQSLLTFGLLEAVIEQPVPENELIKHESGRLVMNKDSLVKIIKDWIGRVRRSREEELTPWLQRIHTSLSQAHSLVVGLAKSGFTVFRALGDDAPSMVCLVAMVGEALVGAKMVFPKGMPQKGFSWSMVWIPPYGEILMKEMVAGGWCPSVAEYLIRTTSVSSLDYAIACGPAEDGKSHAKCVAEACATFMVDEENYTQAHTLSCKSSETSLDTPCKHSTPPLEEVKQFIFGEEIPVITLDDEVHEGPIHLKVHKASDVHYVAISHVWADGLGSTTETGLPTCQLRRLASLVSKIRPGAAFWTDGLCIPKADDVRKTAIGMMGRTYSNAAAVLVLDGSLQLCHSTEARSMKVLRVLTSGWMRRLWTLQEAVLSKELHLVFDGVPLLLKDLMPPPDDMLLFQHMTSLAGELFRLTKLSKYNSYSIGDVARSLRWRTTNRPPDETLAIASLLGVHPSVLVDLDSETRMIRLIQGVGKFPRNILFLNGSKLQVPGFRWAPASFMAAHGGSAGGLEVSTQASDAVLTARGLEAVYYALIFPKTTFERGKPWKIKAQQRDDFYEVRDISSGTGRYTCDMVLLPESIPNGNASPCVAVLRELEAPKAEANGTFTVHCEYKQRLVISNEVVFKDYEEDIILFTLSGKLSVCVS